MRINFLKETIGCLKEYGKKEEDVLWVGRGFGEFPYEEQYKTTWEDFKAKADFDYDNGFGSEEIPEDLVVVGRDFWLERYSYDGREWWTFKTLPKEPTVVRELDLGFDLEQCIMKDAMKSFWMRDWEQDAQKPEVIGDGGFNNAGL